MIGIRFLMIDLDNTLAAYNERKPAQTISEWTAGIKKGGIEMAIVSNSVRKGRVEEFADMLGVGFVKGAHKPSPKSLLHLMRARGYKAGESALIGDQIYTDVLAANLAKIVSIIVRPRRFTNPILAIRYALEAPFRMLARRRGNTTGSRGA